MSAARAAPTARQAFWRSVRQIPPRVPDGPWAAVLRQALAANPEERPASARELAHALEEVTQRLPAFETQRPYPGLASFTEEDAEFFFGRELEVEAVWKKLKRPRMLALIAPSGAGKSSFLRAGLLPTLPRGWKALIATPGNRPFQALAQALVPVFAGDTAGDAGTSSIRGVGRGGVADAALPPAPRARARDRGPVRGAVHAQSRARSSRPSRSSSAGSCSKPTCTWCFRCATTSSSAATRTSLSPPPHGPDARSGR